MKRIALGEIASISSGGTPDRQHPDFWNGKIPWVKTGEIHFNIIRDTEEKITDLAIVGSSTKVYSAGTLLMAMYGQGKTRGQVAVLDIDAAINQACAAIIPSDKEDARYLFQYLSYQYSNIRRLSNSGSQENLNAELIRSIPVYYPEKSVRNKIAEILSAWDDGLEKLDALIAAKERSKKGLMQQLLTGKKRGKGFSNKWPLLPMPEVFERVERPIVGTPQHVLSITAGKGFVDQREKFSRIIAGRNIENYVLLQKGEFAYNKGNSDRYPQGCVYRLEEYEEGAVPNVWISFRLKSGKDSSLFFKHFFLSGGLNHQLNRLINAGVRNDGLLNLTPTNFFRVHVPVPPEDEQAQLGLLFEELASEICLLRARRAAIDQQKRGLMQRLLTGAVRVRTENYG